MRIHNELARLASPNFDDKEKAKLARALRPRVRNQAKSMGRDAVVHAKKVLEKDCMPTGQYVGKGTDRRCVRKPATPAQVRQILKALGL